MSEDEHFFQAFYGIGEQYSSSMKYVTAGCREDIYRIKNNTDNIEVFRLMRHNARHFTDTAWNLLGRYIANNNHLQQITLRKCGITDEKIASLFYELTYSTSIKYLDLSGNLFGREGVQSMIPLLQNSPQLIRLDFRGNTYFDRNNNFNSECFELLIHILHDKPLTELYFGSCNITDISALDRHNLPNLQTLDLSQNDIGREGCRTLSNMLQQEGSTLEHLAIDNSGIGDEEAELLAASLENNNKLESLYLPRNNMGERGRVVFLKLLNNISSIENTYNSNHTLKALEQYSSGQRVSDSTREHVQSAIQINEHYSHSAGRSKVIKYQLNSQMRTKLCRLQGIEYIPGSIFADIEPILLPRILALIGEQHGHSEFYTTLIPMVPDLMSFIDRKSMIKDEMVKNTAQIAALARQQAALSAKNDQLSRRLAEEESTIVEGMGETVAESGRKRQRSDKQ